MKAIISMIKKIGKQPLQRLRQDGTSGMPLGKRLYLFLSVLVITIFLGVFVILLITGTFTAGLSESERFLENELARAVNDIAEQYGQISLATVDLAQNLSRSIEQTAGNLGISLSNLGEHSYLLEEIISRECDKVLFTLLLTRSSGAFLILDATINPALAHAANSRCGLYIKNMEPNVISASTPNITILRGPPGISRERSLPLHAQWRMEFDVSNASYYHRPLAAAASSSSLPLSRLYFWSDALILPGTSEEVMLCTAPLIDSEGCVFGVCGLEVSAMLFKLSHTPENSTYKRLFYLLSPVAGETINLHRSFFAGGYSAKMISSAQNVLQISRQRRHFYTYRQEQGDIFLGLHTDVQFYPYDSAFANQKWIVAALVPEEDITTAITRLNVFLFFSFTLLVIIGIILSFFLGKKFFIKPIFEALNMIKSPDPGPAPKTRIPEIDDLIDYLALRNRELAEKARQENLSFDTLNKFLERTRELSPAERRVFKLYGEGLTAKEIAAQLCLSINTIKTHSKNIYIKLAVNSREEIILYVNLLKEIGKVIH